MDGSSLNITAEKTAQLKQLFPDIFAEDKIDWERLRLAFGEEAFVKDEHYELSWAGKADARKEIQKPTTATLRPKPDESIRFETTGNAFIAGENLEALRVLQRAYFGKVKLIYIDPPYNTGSDSFVYPDDYAERKSDYEQRAGLIDARGFLNKQDLWKKNAKENGQFHSVWLSMMFPRLYLARNLLREDGVMFVSIDDNEQANLKLMLDEIFGQENFVANIIWQKRTSPDSRLLLSAAHDSILVYARSFEKLNDALNLAPLDEKRRNDYTNLDNDDRGVWASRDITGQTGHATPSQFYEITTPNGTKYLPPSGRCWTISKNSFEKLVSENRIWFGKDGGNRPRLKLFLSEIKGKSSWTWWSNKEVGHNQEGTKELNELLELGDIFNNPKPTRLIKRILQLSTNANEEHIVLDFFAGSGTTAQAVLELNQEDGGHRRFLLIQLPEPLDEQSEAFKAGYKTIADICAARIKKVLAKFEADRRAALDFGGNAPDWGFRAYALDYSNFKAWRSDVAGEDAILGQMALLREPLSEYRGSDAAMLTELCLKAGLPLSAERAERQIDGCKIHDIERGTMWVALERVTLPLFRHIAEAKPGQFVTLSSLFAGEDADEIMSNATLQLHEAGVKFTII